MRLSIKDSALPLAAMATDALNPGTILKSRFRIVHDLGQGAFGSTYLASDLDRFDASCTIKQLRLDEHVNHQILTSLFEREARQLFTIGKHQHIPEFLGYFQDGGGHYLAYGYIKGENLLALIRKRVVWTADNIAELWEVMASTLNYIHGLGLVHRDIKPSNIIKSLDCPGYTLIDFGASILQPAEHGTLIGTPGYTPLQQLVHGVAGPESDRHALAMTLIHVLTGLPPSSLFEVYGPNLRGLWIPSVLVPGVSDSLLEEIDSELIDQISSLTIVDTKNVGRTDLNSRFHEASAMPTGHQVSRANQPNPVPATNQTVQFPALSQRSPEISTAHDLTQHAASILSRPASRSVENNYTTKLESRPILTLTSMENAPALIRSLQLRRTALVACIMAVGFGFISSQFCNGRWYCIEVPRNTRSTTRQAIESDVENALNYAGKSRDSDDMSSMLQAHYQLKKLLDAHEESIVEPQLSRLHSEMDQLQDRFTLGRLLDYSDSVIKEARTLKKRPRDVIDHEAYQSLLAQLRSAQVNHVSNTALSQKLHQLQADEVPLSPSSALTPQQARPLSPARISPLPRQAEPVNPPPPSKQSPPISVQPPPRVSSPPQVQQPSKAPASAPQPAPPPAGGSKKYIEPVPGGTF